MRTRRRRRLMVLLVLAGAVAAVLAYRDRSLQRSSSEFLERYGT